MTAHVMPYREMDSRIRCCVERGMESEPSEGSFT